MKRLYKISMAGLLLLLMSSQTGCKKLVDPTAPTEKIGVENVFTNDKTAASVLTRLLADLADVSEGANGYSVLCAIAADDLKAGAWIDLSIEKLHFNKLTGDPTQWWGNFYRLIYTANDAIEQLTVSKGVSESVKASLLGEAHFARAFCYFYLVNTYGDVPLVLITDYTQTMSMGRTDAATGH